jgi:hypothetical protein
VVTALGDGRVRPVSDGHGRGSPTALAICLR